MVHRDWPAGAIHGSKTTGASTKPPGTKRAEHLPPASRAPIYNPSPSFRSTARSTVINVHHMFHGHKIAAKVPRYASFAIWPIRHEMSQPRLVNGHPPCSPGTGMLHGMCHFVLGRASWFRHPFLQVICGAWSVLIHHILSTPLV